MHKAKSTNIPLEQISPVHSSVRDDGFPFRRNFLNISEVLILQHGKYNPDCLRLNFILKEKRRHYKAY